MSYIPETLRSLCISGCGYTSQCMLVKQNRSSPKCNVHTDLSCKCMSTGLLIHFSFGDMHSCCTLTETGKRGRTNTGSVYFSVCDLTAQKMPLSASTCQHDMRHCMSSLLLHCHVGEFQHLPRFTRSCTRDFRHSLLLYTKLTADQTSYSSISSVQKFRR
jgi:hypothetical protein